MSTTVEPTVAADGSRDRRRRRRACRPAAVGAPAEEHAPARVPRPAVRPRPGVGAVPRGLRRPGRQPEAAEAGRRARCAAAGAPVHRRCATRSASAWPRPTIVTHGSDEQKRRYLRPLFTGEEIWCQLFSEPGAGSDVAGARDARRCATATSGSSTARRCGPRSPTRRGWGLLVARTDPDAAQAQGHDVLRRSTCTRPASRCARCGRSPARPSSTRCTSPTCASPTPSGSATSARAGAWR